MVNEDLEMEIMLKMPLKSLMRCLSVSKRWASIIRGEDFKKRYMARSMTRPRLLFSFSRQSPDPSKEVKCHSVYQEEEPLLSCGQQQMRLSPCDDDLFTKPVGGLVCMQSGNTVTIYNPGTGQFMTLPEFKESKFHKESFISNTYFGYDETTDVFKVLCTTNILFGIPFALEEYHVFTLGSDSWRMIEPEDCHHHPAYESVCIGGVLYFATYTRRDRDAVVISFNVMSEELTTIKLPDGFKISVKFELVNYFGEIAIVKRSVKKDEGELRILVRNATSGEWREEHIVIPDWRENAWDKSFAFIGTIGTGELVFAVKKLSQGSHTVLYYDKDNQKLRKFPIDGVVDDSFHDVRTFVNHVDRLSFPI